MKENNKKLKLSKVLKKERRFLIAGVSGFVFSTLATGVLIITTIIFFISMFISSNIEECLWNFVYMGCTFCGALICLIISAKLVEPLHIMNDVYFSDLLDFERSHNDKGVHIQKALISRGDTTMKNSKLSKEQRKENHNQNNMMMNLWVKDKSSGVIHQIGTDIHDSLVYIDGRVEYYNLQNGEGTMGNNLGGYKFVEQPTTKELDDNYVLITPEQLYLNKELMHKDLLKMLNDTEEV